MEKFKVCIAANEDGSFTVSTEGPGKPETAPEMETGMPGTPPAAPGMQPGGMAGAPEMGGMAPAGVQPAPEMEDPEEEEEPAQTVGSLKEAFELALEVFKNDGQMVNHAGQQDAFQSGFSDGSA